MEFKQLFDDGVFLREQLQEHERQKRQFYMETEIEIEGTPGLMEAIARLNKMHAIFIARNTVVKTSLTDARNRIEGILKGGGG